MPLGVGAFRCAWRATPASNGAPLTGCGSAVCAMFLAAPLGRAVATAGASVSIVRCRLGLGVVVYAVRFRPCLLPLQGARAHFSWRLLCGP
eukprot:4768658-Alexandrium_andersonii.AAC.1